MSSTATPSSRGSIGLVVRDGPRGRACYSRRIWVGMIEVTRARLAEPDRHLPPALSS